MKLAIAARLLVGVMISASATMVAAQGAPSKEPARQNPPLVVERSGVTSDAKRIDFVSKITQRAYRLFISIPDSPEPPGGYPVIYLIDGNLHFGIAVDTARIQARWKGVKDPVIVGIGYQTDDLLVALKVRNYDLTMPTTAVFLGSGFRASMPTKLDDFGGMDGYLQMVDDEVKPKVAALVHVDTADQTLMGHSLGGLTTLHALFTRTASFKNFVAISPSIWWNDGSVLADEAAFVERVKAGRVSARVLLSVGSEETGDVLKESDIGIPQALIDAMLRETQMVPNVEQLAARLGKVAGPGLVVQSVVFAGENHNSVPPAGISRGIRFAMHR